MREHNLKDAHRPVPPRACSPCVTGVSGSGKSTLVNDVLLKALMASVYRSRTSPGRFRSLSGAEHLDKVIDVDQSPIGRTPRSNPATYTGVFDHVRRLFAATNEAKVRGYQPGRFSFNVRGGRCEACAGDGTIKIDMQFLPDIYVPCEVCKGKRYNRETLEVHYKGHTIADVLDMSVEEALGLFENIPPIAPPPGHPERRRPRLHQARPAGPDPVRGRGPAGQAGQRAGQAGHRPDPVRARRADHRAPLRGRRASSWGCCTGWSTPATR